MSDAAVSLDRLPLDLSRREPTPAPAPSHRWKPDPPPLPPQPPRRAPSPAVLTITTSHQVLDSLHALVRTGLWGRTPEDVAERLLCDAIRHQETRPR